ncbi:MAG TPA: reverse transcriptase domain-containing protein [Terrimicrobiaceae bacterium]
MGLLTVAKPADLTIPRLSADNYKVWSELIIEALEGRGVWDYVEGLITKPTSDDDLRIWRQNNAIATGIIKGALSESQLGHVMGIRDAQEAWDTLRKIHQTDDHSRVQSLLAEFVKFQLDTTIDEGASKLTRLQSEIGTLDSASKPSDAIKTETLLAGLGPAYESTLVALDASSITKFEEIVSKLRKAETRLKSQGVTLEGQNMARRTLMGNANGSDTLRTKKGVCYHCGKPGHFKRECRKLLTEQRTRPDEGDTEGNRREADGGHRAAVVTSRNEPGTHERAWATSRQVRTVASGNKAQQTDPWYLDSAATSHMANCKDLFTSFKQVKDTVTVADGRQLTSQGQGTVRVRFGSEWVRIHQVLYVPGLQGNLLSIGQLAEKGIECRFSSQGAILRQDGETLANARREGRNFVLYPTQGAHDARNTTVTTEYGRQGPNPDSYELWHRRLGHIGEEKMKLLQTTVTGVTDLAAGPQERCETCAISKSVRTTNKETPERAVKRLQRVYTDFWGPFATPTPSGAKYMLTFTDDFTRKSWIYLVKARTELYGKFREWQTEVERQSIEKLQAIRCDNAREYRALAVDLKQRNGVLVEFTTPYTPEQNGVAERLNRTLTTKIRAMLSGAEIPTELWGEAAYTACYLHNRTARHYGDKVVTPEEIWTGKKPDLAHLKVFGCVAYAQLAKEQRGKLDATSIRGIFVGYTPTVRQYRVYNPETKTVERHSTVRFDEMRKGGNLITSPRDLTPLRIEGEELEAETLRRYLQEEGEGDIGDTITVRARTPPHENTENQVPEPERVRDAVESATEHQSRSGRAIRLPQRYQAQRVTCETGIEITTPTSYDEAVTGPQKKQWEAAIDEELRSLASNHVWELVDTPRGANVVSNKWVFKVKRLPDGRIDRYKARLVARGFSQRYGIDYYETFAPVVRMESLRILLAIAAKEDLEVHQMDVITAYLAGELEEEIYMEPPAGLPGSGQKVCKLRKGLYGLKQSGRVWNQQIGKRLKQSGMIATNGDHSVWVNQDHSLVLALYVDDIVLFAREMQVIRWMKEVLTESFNMKDLGPISTVLGMRVRRDRAQKMLWIDQSHYVGDVLKEFQYTECKPSQTPADGYEYFRPVGAEDISFADMARYQNALGQLSWLVRGTRPDLAFVVHKLSQYCHQPCVRHWKGIQQSFRYLKFSQGLTLRYGQDNKELIGYSDTDFASDASDRKSTMGYVFMLSGAAITWASRKQQAISTSTTEAEYVGLCNAAKEAVWIRNFLRDIGRSTYAGETHATRIFGDNQSALRLVANPEFHSKSKHIDVQHHYVRELLEDGTIGVEYVRTSEMAADCLTKPLKKAQLSANLSILGLRER